MHGAGNDFVVLDETRNIFGLTAAHYRFLADRYLGVGSDQILTVRPSSTPGIDFSYLIHNADGAEVAHCGNGAHCFLAFVRRQGLTSKEHVTVQTMNRVLQLQMQPDGRVTVDMQAPDFDLKSLPFENKGQHCELIGSWLNWPLTLDVQGQEAIIKVVLVSMGNPHAVTLVDDVDTAPVLSYGPLLQGLSAFPRGVNVGFMQVLDRSHIRLRVYERGAGEALACGTGACAAVVAGIRLGKLDATVDVQTRGGVLTVSWQGSGAPVMLTGEASVVFDAEIELPN